MSPWALRRPVPKVRARQPRDDGATTGSQLAIMFEISGIGAIGALLAGVVSFLSPCVLPIVPGYLSYVAGRSLIEPESDAGARAGPIGLGACFVLGFSTIFIILGASATALGQLLLRYRYETNLIGEA